MAELIQTRDLELLRYIAEDGSLTSAARRMHLSQPAISQRLAKLQKRFGVTLFERKGGVMRATAVGDRLVSASRVVRKELEAASADIDRLLDRRRQHLRITTQCYTCYRWLPFVIRDMQRSHPSLILDVVPEATRSPYEALAEGHVDIAIVSDSKIDADFEYHDLFEDELFAVMNTEHPLAGRKTLSPRHFSDQTLVLYTGDDHPVLDEILHPAGVTPGRLIEVQITEAIVELARSGQGIAVLAGWAIDDLDDRNGLTAVRITRAGFRRTWRAAVSGDCAKDRAKSFIRCVRDTANIMRHQDWRRELQRSADTKHTKQAGQP